MLSTANCRRSGACVTCSSVASASDCVSVRYKSDRRRSTINSGVVSKNALKMLSGSLASSTAPNWRASSSNVPANADTAGRTSADLVASSIGCPARSQQPQATTRSDSAACCSSGSAAHSAGSTRVSANRQCTSMSPSIRTRPRCASASHNASAECCERSQLKAGDAECGRSSFASFDLTSPKSCGSSMRCGAWAPNDASLDLAKTL
ncbi:hypothetical protein LMG18091_03870 [Ralstonia wenshanensis]|uniref:Uncharacterized protein n=1 Tax=Ralstonia wenshanensis TaxID=2842456 RepID=A0AAD2EUP9_9RALS|nr:hypothetical protein LMG18091_03870 [Ralstonia wenshanensis]